MRCQSVIIHSQKQEEESLCHTTWHLHYSRFSHTLAAQEGKLFSALYWQGALHKGAKRPFEFVSYASYDHTLGQKHAFYPKIPKNLILEKCEFCEKWDFENVNFVKNQIFKMWILSKWNISKCDFFNVIFWINGKMTKWNS